MLDLIKDHFLEFAIAWVYFSCAVGIAASAAGKSFFLYTLSALYLSPLFIYVLLLAQAAVEKEPVLLQEPEDDIRGWELQRCPRFRTMVRASALECWECHHRLE